MSGDLTEGPVARRLAGLWLPMIAGIVAIKTIGLADAYFIGQLGDQALAAISYTFPVTMTLISLAIGLSAGASSVLSRAIGESSDRDEQREIVAGATLLALLIAVILALAGSLLIGGVLALLGASGQTLADATLYMRIWLIGSLFVVVPIAANGMLRATGDGMSPAILLIVTAILNVGLNPVLVFGLGPAPELGLKGAAVATVTARFVAMVLALAMLWRRGLLAMSSAVLARGVRRWREISIIAGPASLSTSLNPVALSLVTGAAASIGDQAVAAFGVVTKIQSMAVVPLLALSAATPALIGQNSAAGCIDRSRAGLLWSAAISAAWAVLVAAGLYLARVPLAGLFSEDDAIVERIGIYLALVPLSYAGYGIVVALSAAMNGLGRPLTALAISGGRALALLAPLAWLGVYLGGFRGLALGVAAANVLAGVVALAILTRHPLTARGDDVSTDAAECD